MEARPDNGIETDGSMNERRVSVLSMLETSTSTRDHGIETNGSMKERRVAVLSMMETSTSTGDSDHKT
jgi:hypothetical protein